MMRTDPDSALLAWLTTQDWTVTYYDGRDGTTGEITASAPARDAAADKVISHLITTSSAREDDIWVRAVTIDGRPADI